MYYHVSGEPYCLMSVGSGSMCCTKQCGVVGAANVEQGVVVWYNSMEWCLLLYGVVPHGM